MDSVSQLSLLFVLGPVPSTSQPCQHGILLNPCQVGIAVPAYQLSLTTQRLKLSCVRAPCLLCTLSPLSYYIYYVVGFPCNF